jgi:pimeloyl-ACP methyl ester carboxylesterase
VVVGKEKVSQYFVDYFFESLRSDIKNHPFFLINRMSTPFHVRKEFVFSSEVFEKFSGPLLLIAGERDPLLPLNKVLQKYNLLKNTIVRVITKAGHVPFIECPTEFNSIVINFLRN